MATRLTAIAPYFLVADVVRAAEYYRDRLGFTIQGYFFEDPPVFGMVGRDALTIMLALTESIGGGSNRQYKSIGIDAFSGSRTSRRCMPSCTRAARTSWRRPLCGFTA